LHSAPGGTRQGIAEVRRLQADLRTVTEDCDALKERAKELEDSIHDSDVRKRLGLPSLD
jgi:signal transduction histidine kinase